MSKLSDQLRQDAEAGRSPLLGHLHTENLRQIEAADEIDRLTARVAELEKDAEQHHEWVTPQLERLGREIEANDRLRAALEQILAEAVPMGYDGGNYAVELLARSALSGEPIDVRKRPSLCRNPNKGGGYCPDCGQVHSAVEWPRATDETTGEQK